MNPIYELQDLVERDLARNAGAITDGIAQNLALLADEKLSQDGVLVVDLERMQRLGLVNKEKKLTGYGRGVHNQLAASGYYGKKTYVGAETR